LTRTHCRGGGGTGKTTELVHRMVNIIERARRLSTESSLSPSRKAAGELRLRLRVELDAACTATKIRMRLSVSKRACLEGRTSGPFTLFALNYPQAAVEARSTLIRRGLDENQSARLMRAFDA
jgi:hypothetical protein